MLRELEPTGEDLKLIEPEAESLFEPLEFDTVDLQHDREGLTQYLKDLKPYLPLRPNTRLEDENMIKAGDAQGLFFSVARMVVSQALRRATEKVPAMDLIQEGNLAVLRLAIPTYDYTKAKSSTWAMWYIKRAQELEIKRNFRGYGIYAGTVKNVEVLNDKFYAFTAENGREPSFIELAGLTGFKPSEVALLMEISQTRTASLYSSIDSEGELELVDVVEDKNALNRVSLEDHIDDADGKTEDKTAIASMSAELRSLPPRQADILRLRLGIDEDGQGTGKVSTFKEIAGLQGVSPRRIVQLQSQALKYIKNPTLHAALVEVLHPHPSRKVSARNTPPNTPPRQPNMTSSVL